MTGLLLMRRTLSKWYMHLGKILDYHLLSMPHGSMNDADMPVYPVLNMTLALDKSRNEESSGPTHCNFEKTKNKVNLET